MGICFRQDNSFGKWRGLLISKMKLRDFKKEDAPIIASWLRSEEELYKWSSDRFNKYPLSGDDIIENYTPQLETGRFFPLTAVDDSEKVVGHFIIRYPREDEDSSVRFGFVILNPELRGKGLGKEMLRLGIEYVKTRLSATRVDLGVFENNESAGHCYESVGFKRYGIRACKMPIGTWNCIDMELFLKRTLETESIQYDTANLNDISELVRLRILYMIDDFGSITDQERKSMENQLPGYFERELGKKLIAFVARAEDRLVATAYLLIIEKPANPFFPNGFDSEVLSVYTEEKYRGKGICTKLMRNMIEYAREHGLCRIDLMATDKGYPIYKKLGFEDKVQKYKDMRLKL